MVPVPGAPCRPRSQVLERGDHGAQRFSPCRSSRTPRCWKLHSAERARFVSMTALVDPVQAANAPMVAGTVRKGQFYHFAGPRYALSGRLSKSSWWLPLLDQLDPGHQPSSGHDSLDRDADRSVLTGAVHHQRRGARHHGYADLLRIVDAGVSATTRCPPEPPPTPSASWSRALPGPSKLR